MMKTIGITLICLAVLTMVTLVVFGTKRILDRKQENLKIFEPDLSFLEQPDLIEKIPENENIIPDSNEKHFHGSNTIHRSEKQHSR